MKRHEAGSLHYAHDDDVDPDLEPAWKFFLLLGPRVVCCVAVSPVLVGAALLKFFVKTRRGRR